MAFKLNGADLEFVLKQIKIGEANANGIALTEIRLDANGEVITDASWYTAGNMAANPVRAIPDDQAPYGIRTVDGSYNNIIEGRELWGSAGQGMPRLLDGGAYLNESDGDSVMFGGGNALTNGNYTPGTPSGNAMIPNGSVADADPRIISNLVSDMSLNNPAAIVAALTFAGNENPYATLAAIQAASPSWEADLAVMLNPLTTAEAKAMARDNVNLVLEPYEIEVDTSGSLSIPNVAPDEGLSAPFNAWMTFFGQFFDHGLDLITKGNAGTIYVPLQSDDPLYVEGSSSNFMVLTRSTPFTNADGEQSQRNVTTAWVDQNQTYTSHASHQVFLREYVRIGDETLTTGKLLDGSNTVDGVTTKNGLPTWGDLKTQAREMLGIELTDRDVGSVPMIRTDAYGNFIPDPVTGYAQLILGFGADGIPNTADDVTVSGTPAAPVNTFTASATVEGTVFTGALRTPNAFLDDIAHNAVPTTGTGAAKVADGDSGVGYFEADGVTPAPLVRGSASQYDNELLDRHFITGDGRGNENIGLTAVHHIFHSEHNRQVELQKKTILESGDLAFINEWLREPITNLDQIDTPVEIAALQWNGERLFQSGRFSTEMQYQHLVFEEFGRKIQPAIDPFVFNSVPDLDPSIFAEFANVVYRFGHSMLTDSMPRVFVAENGVVVGQDDMGLIASFLNPVVFDNDGALSAEEAAGAIVRGMTTERGNEIDEFLTGALRNNLLGIPLDLGAINIARGRDTNMATLNEAREQLYAATGSSFLTPYSSWAEFATNLKNPLSVVNFIAAYGTHGSITGTVAEKRDAAMALVLGGDGAPADRVAFLNGTGAWSAVTSGLNAIDLWIGGLAEKKMPFGGFLGSTFNAIFEAQMEGLQDGDRFYYLTRTQGQNFLTELEQNSFAKMIMANTDISQPGLDGIRGTDDDIVTRHIGVDSFAAYDYVFEVNPANQQDYDPNNLSASGVDPLGNDPILEALGLGKVVRDDPRTSAVETNYFRTFGGEHVVVGGTNQNDTIITDFGDDGIWGDGGDDRIESGAGVDLVNGGAGNDIITDSGDTGDFLKGDAGDDVIANSNGLDIIMGGTGNDAVFVGVDDTEVFGGEGDDFILGGDGVDMLIGGEGSDWIEGGGGFDTIAGDNSELFFNSKILGHDVMFSGSEEHDFDAESGDDIMIQGESVIRNEGMFGYDWVGYKGNNIAADADLTLRIFTTEEQDILRNRFDQVEGLSGWDKNDVLRGDSRTNAPDPGADPLDPPTPDLPETRMDGSELSHAGVDRIDGLRALLGGWLEAEGPAGSDREKTIAFEGGNVILGGGGSDLIEGRGGNDIIDGDKWLNVRIRITAAGQENTATNQIATIDSMKHTFAAGAGIPAAWVGKTLFQLMIDRVIVPNQLHIVREIVETNTTGTDTAVYWDALETYSFSSTDDALLVSHTGFDEANRPEGTNLVSDGTDMVRNVEALQFQNAGNNGPVITLGVIEGTTAGDTLNGTANAEIIVGFAGNDTLNGLGGNDILLGGSGADTLNGGEGNDTLIGGAGGNTGTFADNFDTASYSNNTGTLTFNGAWTESDNNSGTDGDIEVESGRLTFDQSIDGGEWVQRAFNLTGATSATVQFTYIGDTSITGEENVTVQAWNSSTNSWQTLTGGVLQQTGTGMFSAALTAAQIGPNSQIRFTANGNWDDGDNFSIDDFVVTATGTDLGVDTLNGGAGNDTYVMALGDGNDVISDASGSDGIQILANGADLSSLNLERVSAGGTTADDLRIRFGTSQIDIQSHFSPNAASATPGTGAVETITFVGDATIHGYEVGTDAYNINASRALTLDGTIENDILVAATQTGNTTTTLNGDAGNDMLFGAGGIDELNGGAGDDLLVGGAGNDELDGGLGADTMVGGAGNDIYVVDDAGDVVAEEVNAGIDEVQTTLTTYTLGANVEDLTYTGTAAFAGTGNDLNNVIEGGAGIDTLTGLGGNDTYVVTAGDIIVEAAGGGTDTVESAASYTLGAEIENLTLTGTTDGAVGTGNGLANVINGSAGANQLFGGAGNDTINGGDDADLIDGGTGDDTLSGGTGNDTDTIIGGEGNDTISVSDGNDYIRYTAANFGNDVITGFDAAGGNINNQDLIDLSALGITAGNFASRVSITAGTGANTGDTIVTVDGASGGTIRIDNVTSGNISASDFLLAAAAPTTPLPGGTNGPNTITGNGADNLINGLGGNDTLSGAGGDDVVNGGEGADTLNGGDGNDTLSGGTGSDTGTYRDEFGSQVYTNNNGMLAFNGSWTEGSINVGGSETGGASGGDIDISAGRLRFNAGVDGGEFIQRSFNLAGATSATVQFAYEDDNLNADESIVVEAWNINTNSWQTLTSGNFGGILGSTTGNGAGNFTANLTADQIGATSAIRFRATGDGNNWDNGDNFYIDNFTVSATTPGLNAGVDTINGDAGDDTIIWNANASGATDGRDLVNGGTETATGAGDTFVINGNASAETYNIYTRAAFLGVAGNAAVPLAAATEIVVTRNGENGAAIIAELSEIEEIRVNSVDPSGTTGTAGGDTFNIVGDFSTTSLRLNTITIDGSSGDDVVDITSLSSAHRIVFKSNGGNDTIVGTLREQDVVELPDGAVPADYETTTDASSGVTTMTNGSHTIRFTAPNGLPQVGAGNDDDQDDDDHDVDDDHDDDDGDDHDYDGDDDVTDGVVPPPASGVVAGTVGDDVLMGSSGNDLIFGRAGVDYIIAGAGADVIRGDAGDDLVQAGAGRDMVYGGDGDDDLFGEGGDDMLGGEEGNDRLFGGNGNDMLDGGAGDDIVHGDDGNDAFIARIGDGNDTYDGGAGLDSLDMGSLTLGVAVDLGTGIGGRGSVVGSQSGIDTLYGIENVTTGSGADTITASAAVNVMDGGAGNDVFVFSSAAAAHGDTIVGFETGDVIDLSGIDADTGTAGVQSFTLVAGQMATAAGQLVVTHETRDDGAFTIISGNTGGDNEPEFRLELQGSRTLTTSDFNL